MFITNILLKKAKSKYVLMCMESMVSGHTFQAARERLGEKLEVMWFDPYVQQKVVYREKKKLKSLSSKFVPKREKYDKMLGLDEDTLIKNAEIYNKKIAEQKKNEAK